MHPFMDRWNHNTELYPTVAELIRGHELVLDVGCGDGTLVDYLNGLGHRAMGVDHDQSVLPTGEDANCHWADATNLPFVHDSFDAVVTVATLHHHRDPTLALGEMRRVLRPGGIIVVVGLAADRAPADYARSARDSVRSTWLARGKTGWEPPVEIVDPSKSWAETREQVLAVLEGGSFQRVGSFRYLAVWHSNR